MKKKRKEDYLLTNREKILQQYQFFMIKSLSVGFFETRAKVYCKWKNVRRTWKYFDSMSKSELMRNAVGRVCKKTVSKATFPSRLKKCQWMLVYTINHWKGNKNSKATARNMTDHLNGDGISCMCLNILNKFEATDSEKV